MWILISSILIFKITNADVTPKIYAIGGESEFFATSSVEVYDFETGTWSPGPPLPSHRQEFGAATLNGRLYAIGGYNDNESKYLKTVDIFDPATQNWTSAPSMNSKRGRIPGVAVFDGKIYVMGGYDGDSVLSSIEMFDPQSNNWTIVGQGMNIFERKNKQTTEQLNERQYLAAGVLSGSIYAVGGWQGRSAHVTYTRHNIDGSSHIVIQLGAWEVGKTVVKFNPETGASTYVASMNRGSHYGRHCVAVLNGKLYAIGGDGIKSVEVYDPISNSWSDVADLPENRCGAGAVVYNGRIYVVGGRHHDDHYNSTVVYDPLTDTWSTLPVQMSIGRGGHAVALL